MTDVKSMQIGQIVDFTIAYNNRQKQGEKEKKGKQKRRATQKDINAFFG